jgi:16S rRNA (guanine527-N7)-methyltransferase
VSDLRAAVGAICDRLTLSSSEAQRAALADFLALLQRWNATYNLTAIRDPALLLTHHLADCLAVVGPLRRHLGDPTGKRLLDVGSGGGLPGVVLAIMLPGLDVTCVDTVGKKVAFVRQAAAELGLPSVHGVHARVEAMTGPGFDVVVSRAFASLADFVQLSRPRLTPGGAWLAMKGRTPTAEIAALPADIEMFHVEPLQLPGLDAERCLIWMRPRRVIEGP